MNYRAFGDFYTGYAHLKNESEAEDRACAFTDPEGRFSIAAVCDGHSDKNCFRSARGAEFGCAAAREVLTSFFTLYLAESPRLLPEGTLDRLKRAIRQSWEDKVYEDLNREPVRTEELVPLSEHVRSLYSDGHCLTNIYGATFLAAAVCEDFFLALQIGDGILLCVEEDGICTQPLPRDELSETGSPASLCDANLITRPYAFRGVIREKLPQIATVSSDGIPDCMTEFDYKKFTCGLMKAIESLETPDQSREELNPEQCGKLRQCLEFYASQGHGAEDDCSLACVFDLDRGVPKFSVPQEEAVQLWKTCMQARNDMVSDYGRRKLHLKQKICSLEQNGSSDLAENEKAQELQQTWWILLKNEKEKLNFFERQLGEIEKFMTEETLNSPELLQRAEVVPVEIQGLAEEDTRTPTVCDSPSLNDGEAATAPPVPRMESPEGVWTEPKKKQTMPGPWQWWKNILGLLKNR